MVAALAISSSKIVYMARLTRVAAIMHSACLPRLYGRAQIILSIISNGIVSFFLAFTIAAAFSISSSFVMR